MTTTGTSPTGPAAVVYAPALTQEEVTVAVPCPLCGADAGEACEHPMSRWRAALRMATA